MSNSVGEWLLWQSDIVMTVRQEFRELFQSVRHDDFDWDAWRPLYEQGYRPLSAVKQAFSTLSNS